MMGSRWAAWRGRASRYRSRERSRLHRYRAAANGPPRRERAAGTGEAIGVRYAVVARNAEPAVGWHDADGRGRSDELFVGRRRRREVVPSESGSAGDRGVTNSVR